MSRCKLNDRALGRKISRAMHRCGLTQARLAERMGTSQPTVSAMLAGKRRITTAQLAAVVDAIEPGADLRWELLCRINDAGPPSAEPPP